MNNNGFSICTIWTWCDALRTQIEEYEWKNIDLEIKGLKIGAESGRSVAEEYSCLLGIKK